MDEWFITFTQTGFEIFVALALVACFAAAVWLLVSFLVFIFDF